jgi:hypothetical protein
MFSKGNNFQKIKKKFKQNFDGDNDNPQGKKKRKEKNAYRLVRQEKRT